MRRRTARRIVARSLDPRVYYKRATVRRAILLAMPELSTPDRQWVAQGLSWQAWKRGRVASSTI